MALQKGQRLREAGQFEVAAVGQIKSAGDSECVDFVIFASSTLTGQVNGTTFPFVYGPATYLDKPGSTV
ncbi:hypothetical protein CIW71_24185 (plasmid) [Xanthomonas citri pv. malvacearum]|nr:hypothetical protein CIW71_24185 [Xanthomonas citri pv. malvacearum]